MILQIRIIHILPFKIFYTKFKINENENEILLSDCKVSHTNQQQLQLALQEYHSKPVGKNFKAYFTRYIHFQFVYLFVSDFLVIDFHLNLHKFCISQKRNNKEEIVNYNPIKILVF